MAVDQRLSELGRQLSVLGLIVGKVCTTCGHGTPVQAKASRKSTPAVSKPPSNQHVTTLARQALARTRKGQR